MKMILQLSRKKFRSKPLHKSKSFNIKKSSNLNKPHRKRILMSSQKVRKMFRWFNHSNSIMIIPNRHSSHSTNSITTTNKCADSRASWFKGSLKKFNTQTSIKILTKLPSSSIAVILSILAVIWTFQVIIKWESTMLLLITMPMQIPQTSLITHTLSITSLNLVSLFQMETTCSRTNKTEVQYLTTKIEPISS